MTSIFVLNNLSSAADIDSMYGPHFDNTMVFGFLLVQGAMEKAMIFLYQEESFLAYLNYYSHFFRPPTTY